MGDEDRVDSLMTAFAVASYVAALALMMFLLAAWWLG